MTLDSISRDIAQAQIEFAELNRQHYRHRNARGHFIRRVYVALDPATERRISKLAERLAALHRIAGWVGAKHLLTKMAVRSNGYS